MQTIIFNGRKYAAKKEEKLKEKVKQLNKRGIRPKLVSILVGDNQASRLYISLKKQAAERVGVELEVKEFTSNVSSSKIVRKIENLNQDASINGIMVQMSLPDSLKPKTKEIVNKISLDKDIDALGKDSPFIQPTVKAILQLIKLAKGNRTKKKVVVVGAKGMVGRPLVKELRKENYPVIECDKETKDLKLKTKKAGILVSATGVCDIIKGNMVREGAVVIDVGAPKGDVSFKEVAKKASFITPVPNGVGPLTIAYLIENLVLAAIMQNQ